MRLVLEGEDDFARLSGLHEFHGALKFGVVHLVGDHRIEVEFAGRQEGGHIIPGLPEFTADDALEIDALEDEGVDIDGLGVLAVHAEEGEASAGASVLDGESEGGRMAGHFQGAIESAGDEDIELFGDINLRWVEDDIDADLAGEINAEGADFGGHHLGGAEGFTDGDGKEADGAHAGDEDVLILDRTRHGGMHGVAEGVLERGNLYGDRSIGGACVVLGDDNVFGKPAIDIHAENLGVYTDMPLAVLTLSAATTDDVGFAGYELADFPVSDAFADFDDGSAELMANDPGRLDAGGGPSVPTVDVEVGSADGRGLQLNFDVARQNGRFGGLNDLDPGSGVNFRDRFHRGESVPALRACPWGSFLRGLGWV